jgi:hypothetical protein
MRARTHAVSGIVALVVGGLLLAGCDSHGSAAASIGSVNGAVAQAPAAGARAAQSAPAAQPLTIPGRQVIRSASIGIRVINLGDTENAVRRIATAVGGYAGQEDDQSRQASFTLQVPQAHLDGVLAQLSRLGRQTSRTEQAQDVTDEMVDVRSRLATQQVSVNRVRALMDRATSIANVVSIEGELTKREADLESLEQQQAELAGQVAMSSVTVQLSQVTTLVAATTPGPGGFVGGLVAGWHAFLGALGVLLIVLGAVLPFVVVLGGVGAAVWWLVRRRRSTTPAVAGEE